MKLQDFLELPIEEQAAYYLGHIKVTKFNLSSMIWEERLRTAIERDCPQALIPFPQLAEVYKYIKHG